MYLCVYCDLTAIQYCIILCIKVILNMTSASDIGGKEIVDAGPDNRKTIVII